MFERYFGESSIDIPRESLSTPTKRNLFWLEIANGFKFDDTARKAMFGWRPSYLIPGIGPSGEEAFFERRETSGRGAGQTYIWLDGKRFRLEDLGVPSKLPTPSDIESVVLQPDVGDWSELAPKEKANLMSLLSKLMGGGRRKADEL